MPYNVLPSSINKYLMAVHETFINFNHLNMASAHSPPHIDVSLCTYQFFCEALKKMAFSRALYTGDRPAEKKMGIMYE